MKLCKKCKEYYGKTGGLLYPQYGLAPHSHDMKKTGSIIGSTVIASKKKWPDNFHEDFEAAGCGVYTCPDMNCASH